MSYQHEWNKCDADGWILVLLGQSCNYNNDSAIFSTLEPASQLKSKTRRKASLCQALSGLILKMGAEYK